MPYLVDGNNLLGFLSGKPRPSAEDRHRLLRGIADRLRKVRARVFVVFDGPAEHGTAHSTLGPLSIQYSGRRCADDVIAEIAARSRAPADQHVVTDDRGLAARVRAAGATTLSVSEFWARFSRPALRTEKAESVDLEEWAEFFSDESNRLT
jgi:predicted RNA-binding protein with PIN domain